MTGACLKRAYYLVLIYRPPKFCLSRSCSTKHKILFRNLFNRLSRSLREQLHLAGARGEIRAESVFSCPCRSQGRQEAVAGQNYIARSATIRGGPSRLSTWLRSWQPSVSGLGRGQQPGQAYIGVRIASARQPLFAGTARREDWAFGLLPLVCALLFELPNTGKVPLVSAVQFGFFLLEAFYPSN